MFLFDAEGEFTKRMELTSARNPEELDAAIRTQLTEVVSFQLTDKKALEYPQKFGFDIEAVRKLEPHRFIGRNNRGGETRG